MGICESNPKPPQNINKENQTYYTEENPIINKYNTPISKSICEINSKSGTKGIGFFCRIPFGNIHALITSNEILNNGDLISGQNILIYFKNNDKYINININDTRKLYSSETYQRTIIEIIPYDNINFIDYLDVNSYLNQNQKEIIILIMEIITKKNNI